MGRTQDVTEEAPFPYLVTGQDTQERAGRSKRKNLIGQVLDLLALALLGLATLTAAFAGYQSTSWSTQSQLRYHQASAQLSLANAETLRATQQLVADVAGGATPGTVDADLDVRTHLSKASTASDASAQLLAEASEADEAASRFLLAGVFVVVVLFLTGAATVVRQPPIKGMVLGGALGVYGAAALYLLFLPFTFL